MKIFATDLDGTLLKKGGIIDDNIIKSVRKLTNNDYRLIAVSGRVSSSIRFLTNQLGVKDYIIANNGALVLDKDDNIVFDWPFSFEQINLIFNLADKYNIDIRMYSKDTYFSKYNNLKQIKHMKISENLYSVNLNIRNNIKEYIHDNNINIYKVLLDTNQANYHEFYNELKEISNIYLTYSGKTNLDIMAKDVSKSRALKFLIEHLKQNNEEISKLVSIGDYYNDISMIEMSDIGIAMGNACDDLKLKADFITLDNSNNGFEKAVENILSIKDN